MKLFLKRFLGGLLIGAMLFSLFPNLSTARALVFFACGALVYFFFIEKIISKPKRGSALESISNDLFKIKRELGLIPRSPRDWEDEDFDEHEEFNTPFQYYEFYKGDIRELVLWRIESDEYIMKLAKERDVHLSKQEFDQIPSLEMYVTEMLQRRKGEAEDVIRFVAEQKISRDEMLKGMNSHLKWLQDHRTISRGVIRDYEDKMQRCGALFNRVSERYAQGEKDLIGEDWKPICNRGWARGASLWIY